VLARIAASMAVPAAIIQLLIDFQAVTENFYAADASLVAPLILVGREYWNEVYPVWPLLQRLAAGRPMGELIYCVDDVKEATGLLTSGV
jgi:hypothetical protein